MRDRNVRTLVTRIVHAPRHHVYAAYTDPAVLSRMMGIHAIVDATGPLDRAGTIFTERVFGPHRSRSEVLAADPPRLHDMRGTTFFGLGYRWIAHFTEMVGSTEVSIDAEVILPGIVGRVLGVLVIAEAVERSMQRRLATFATLVERRDSPSSDPPDERR